MRVDRTTVSNMIEERLRQIGEEFYPASWALLETMFHLAAGTTYKQTATNFGNGSFRLSRIVRVVLGILANKVAIPVVSLVIFFLASVITHLFFIILIVFQIVLNFIQQMPDTPQMWLAYEQAMFAKYGVSHVLMLMDIYESPVASRNILFRNDKGQYVVKFMFVLSPADEIIHLSCWPGSLSNQIIFEKSDFGEKLRDPSNPLRIPKNLRFRTGEGYASPCCLADNDWSATYPFLLVCPGIQQRRLAIERFFGRFTAINRFLLSYVLIEHNHILRDMVFSAAALWNFRIQWLEDPSHVHTVACAHYLHNFYDIGRIVENVPVLDPWANRSAIMIYYGRQPRVDVLPLFDRPGQNDGIIDMEDLRQFVLMEQEIVGPGGVPEPDPRFEAMAQDFVRPVNQLP